jgi:ATP-dependent Clp protease ATP-binding subunit ClpA
MLVDNLEKIATFNRNNRITLFRVFKYLLVNDVDFKYLLENSGVIIDILFNSVNSHIIRYDDMDYEERIPNVRIVVSSQILEIFGDFWKELSSSEFFQKYLRYVAENNHQDYFISYLITSGFDLQKYLKTTKSKEKNSTSVSKNYKGVDEFEQSHKQFVVNLNKKASEGKIDPIIGRDDEIRKSLVVLEKRKKANVVLLGKAGVGKSAIVEGLALRLAEGSVNDKIKDMIIFELNLTDMLSGTKYRGEFEAKVSSMLKGLMSLKENKICEPVLFIDELHTIVGAGGSGSENQGLAESLKPYLARGEVRVIGATTDDEWTACIEQNKALQRRFNRIMVDEPSIEETISILMKSKHLFEAKHNVIYTEESVRSIVNLSSTYITETSRPDSSVDLLDYVGSYLNLEGHKEDYTGTKVENKDGVLVVIKEHVEERLANLKNFPVKILRETKTEEDLKPIAQNIKKYIFNQDKAIEVIGKAIDRYKAGFKRVNKPIASFLLTGPTGVGKTETAKKIAEEMNAHFMRIDMSEYMEEHSVSKLIGSPPGYVGHESKSLLREINDHKYVVLVLDEVEKAHPKVLTILLQAMDNARIVDSRNNSIDFNHTLILMTSNLGAKAASQSSIGFTGNKKSTEVEKAVTSFFAPEFIGRLTAVVKYEELNELSIEKIVDKFIQEINTTFLKSKNIEIELTEKATKSIIELGYNKSLGARPLEKTIDTYIIDLLTESIILKKIKKGKVAIDYKDGKFVIVKKRKETL